MRFSGSSEPARRVGPFGHVSTFFAPARIAERYSASSALVRPGFKFMLFVSPLRNAVSDTGPAIADARDAAAESLLTTSPPAVPFEPLPAGELLACALVLSGVAALALGFPLHAASATAPAAAKESINSLRYVMFSRSLRGVCGV